MRCVAEAFRKLILPRAPSCQSAVDAVKLVIALHLCEALRNQAFKTTVLIATSRKRQRAPPETIQRQLRPTCSRKCPQTVALSGHDVGIVQLTCSMSDLTELYKLTATEVVRLLQAKTVCTGLARKRLVFRCFLCGSKVSSGTLIYTYVGHTVALSRGSSCSDSGDDCVCAAAPCRHDNQ